jgi:hypothetical protein
LNFGTVGFSDKKSSPRMSPRFLVFPARRRSGRAGALLRRPFAAATSFVSFSLGTGMVEGLDGNSSNTLPLRATRRELRRGGAALADPLLLAAAVPVDFLEGRRFDTSCCAKNEKARKTMK